MVESSWLHVLCLTLAVCLGCTSPRLSPPFLTSDFFTLLIVKPVLKQSRNKQEARLAGLREGRASPSLDTGTWVVEGDCGPQPQSGWSIALQSPGHTPRSAGYPAPGDTRLGWEHRRLCPSLAEPSSVLKPRSPQRFAEWHGRVAPSARAERLSANSLIPAKGSLGPATPRTQHLGLCGELSHQLLGAGSPLPQALSLKDLAAVTACWLPSQRASCNGPGLPAPSCSELPIRRAFIPCNNRHSPGNQSRQQLPPHRPLSRGASGQHDCWVFHSGTAG